MAQQTTPARNDESECKELHFDGENEGNPGEMRYGFILETPDGTEIEEYNWLGGGTNNKTEYQALHHGVKDTVEGSVSKFVVKGDSELIIEQVLGEYSVKDEGLQQLHAEARELAR